MVVVPALPKNQEVFFFVWFGFCSSIVVCAREASSDAIAAWDFLGWGPGREGLFAVDFQKQQREDEPQNTCCWKGTCVFNRAKWEEAASLSLHIKSRTVLNRLVDLECLLSYLINSFVSVSQKYLKDEFACRCIDLLGGRDVSEIKANISYIFSKK